MVDIIKKPYKKERWTESQILEVAKCIGDPVYFAKKYIKVQHPMRGRIPLELFPYQEEIINGFKNHRNTILLAGRQLGKCCSFSTKISVNGEQKEIGSLIKDKLDFKDKVVCWLEDKLLKLSTSK